MISDEQICAEMVRKQDPERFLSAMTAPPEKRGELMVIYAFNLELARIPWVSKEPMIAEMRLQWWRDILEEIFAGKVEETHEVAKPLGRIINLHNLPREVFERMIDARVWDIYTEPHKDITAFERYIRDTAGGVMLLTAMVLATDVPQEDILELGHAHGTSLLLRAVPALDQLGRRPLVDRDAVEIGNLAEKSLHTYEQARKRLRRVDKQILPALRSGWLARGVLRKASSNPNNVLHGGLEPSQAGMRFSLMVKTALGSF